MFQACICPQMISLNFFQTISSFKILEFNHAYRSWDVCGVKVSQYCPHRWGNSFIKMKMMEHGVSECGGHSGFFQCKPYSFFLRNLRKGNLPAEEFFISVISIWRTAVLIYFCKPLWSCSASQFCKSEVLAGSLAVLVSLLNVTQGWSLKVSTSAYWALIRRIVEMTLVEFSRWLFKKLAFYRYCMYLGVSSFLVHTKYIQKYSLWKSFTSLCITLTYLWNVILKQTNKKIAPLFSARTNHSLFQGPVQ